MDRCIHVSLYSIGMHTIAAVPLTARPAKGMGCRELCWTVMHRKSLYLYTGIGDF